MKITNYYLAFLTLITLGCSKKEDVIETDKEVGHSKITYFVELALTGPEFVSIVKDENFADPGALATENGQSVPVQVGNQLNKSVPGFYQVSYSATNADGFAKTVYRNIFVLPSAEVPGIDLTGSYSLTGADLISTFTRILPGVYSASNLNHPATAISGYFICTDGLNIIIPVQSTPYGPLNGSGTYDPATKKIVWTLNIPSQSYIRTRTFTKQ